MAKDIQHIRHSLAHLLGAAVLDLYPGSKLAIGPAVDDGFYYDIDIPEKVSDTDLPKIEKKMEEILKTWKGFEGREVSAEEAKEIFKDNPFKLEIIQELADKGEKITLYTSGNFTDLCRGGHVEEIKDINPKAFKLSRLAGAYWRGDEKNPQLTRIYGLAFETKDDLQKHLLFLEEVKKRDHRVLAQQLDLFSQHDVSPGAIFWHPKGMVLWKELENYIRSKNDQYGYGEVSTPIMVKKELYETSGHWDHYREDGFWFDVSDETYVLKPMNCPEATVIYSNTLRSYRDLPLRLSEPTGRLHRNELKGALGGLFRVRQFTQDDAHVFCRPDQIEQEVSSLLQYTKEVYETFGLPISFRFATKPDKAMGDPELWEKAEAALEGILKKLNITYQLKEKDGAFYGPKIDIHAKDAIGREHQVATIQLDFQMPERFKLEYHDADGTIKRPVMIHRAIFGSFERFLGVLIEHYAGAFPLWLSPIQVAVVTISENHQAWGEAVVHKLRHAGIRAELHNQNETLGKKIRNAETQKIPYIFVVGDKEAEAQSVAVRKRSQGDMGTMLVDTAVAQLKEEVDLKK
jgi:threonyl-tRNA synthetase